MDSRYADRQFLENMSDSQIREFLACKEFVEMKREVYSKVHELAGGEVVGINKFADIVVRHFPPFAGMVGSSEIHEFYAEYLYHVAGEKEYQIHPNLIKRFENTNIKNVPTELFRLPFKTIKLKIPSNSLPFEINDGRTMLADEIIISELTTKDIKGDETLRKSHHGNPRELEGINSGVKVFLRKAPYFFYFWIWLEKEELHLCVEDSIAFSRNQYGNYGDKLKFLQDKIEFAVEFQKTNPSYPVNEVIKEHKDNIFFTPAKEEQIRHQFEFVIKTVLYLNGANADVYWSDDRPQLQAQLKRAVATAKKQKIAKQLEKARGVFKVGHKIVISREEKEMYDSAVNNSVIAARFIVQGHFRNQAYGEGFSKRKLIFIEPFWKGSEYAEYINKPHIAK